MLSGGVFLRNVTGNAGSDGQTRNHDSGENQIMFHSSPKTLTPPGFFANPQNELGQRFRSGQQKNDQISLTGQRETVVNIGQMTFDGGIGNFQIPGDFLYLPAFQNQKADLPFARREMVFAVFHTGKSSKAIAKFLSETRMQRIPKRKGKCG